MSNSEPPTKPGTPDAIRAKRTASGSFELPRTLIDQLVDTKIHVLQERLAVVEAEIAHERAHRRGLEQEIDRLRAELRTTKRGGVLEIGPKSDPRSA